MRAMRWEGRKETSKSSVAARARTLQAADLGWLAGFPLGLRDGSVLWRAVPAHGPAQEMDVDRQHLSRATYTLNKLRGELASAVPLILDEPAVWLESVEHRLALLKRAVHQGEPLPESLFAAPFVPRAPREHASRLAAGAPRVRPLLDALSWVHAGDPARLRSCLQVVPEWVTGWELLADRLGERCAIVALLRLLELAASHGRERVQALVLCLFDERCHDAALEGGWGICEQILGGIGKKRGKAPLPGKLPAGTFASELASWCEDLVQENHRATQLALRLFTLATPMPLVERWAGWWETTRRLLRETRALRALPYERESRHLMRTQVQTHQRETPPELEVTELLAAFRRLTSSGLPARATRLAGALAAVPPQAVAPGRAHFFIYWSFLGDAAGTSPSQIDSWLAGFERYLRRQAMADAELLAPWKDLIAKPRWSFGDVELGLCDHALPRQKVLEAYEYLADVASRYGGLDPRAAGKAVEVFVLAGSAELAAGLFASLRARESLASFYAGASARLALRLCRDNPERFAGVLAALAAQEERGELPPSWWPEPVVAALGTGPLGEVARETLVTRQLARLLACGTKAVLLEAAGTLPAQLPTPGATEESAKTTAAWVGRYPEPLRGVLGRLAEVLDDAEPKAARWLAADLPDAGRLEREIHALEQRLPAADPARQDALRTRLGNLRARLAQPAAPSSVRIERLRAKLERAWGRAILERWEGELDASLPEALRQLLGIADVPPWLREARPLALLATACRMHGDRRQLAVRLFRERCGPPPWDLRDAPQNRRFVESLPALDWSAWIDGPGTEEVRTDGGQNLRLALEDDPLEIFRMGAHFQTCLSPGDINYFSVFANAADINKRVLYLRDAAGSVVGRCLLALTAQGELLTFEAYCHDASLDFGRLSDDFAQRLALRMGTARAVRGRVPTLVASSWYDDGPRNLGRLHAALEEGSPLRRRLATVRPDQIVAELRQSLKPARLNEATLPLVLDLAELRQRPELVVPLLRLVADCRQLPEDSLVTAAHLGLQAGATDLVRHLFAAPVAESLRRAYRYGTWVDLRALDVLVRLVPARLLSVLRSTRRRSVRDWLHETDGDRLEGAASAFAALHRPRQAQALWKRLAHDLNIHAYGEQRLRAREALEARPDA